MKSWESYEVQITDGGGNIAPVANDDTVFANAGTTIAEMESNDPVSGDLVNSAQVIERSSFRIAPTADVEDDALPRVSIDGSIDPVSDVDVYAITLKAGETLVLDIDYGVAVDFLDPTNVDTQLFVLDVNGNILDVNGNILPDPIPVGIDPASNDNEMIELGGAGSARPFDAFLEFTATDAGTYYVAVTSFDNDPSGNGTFDGDGNSSGDYVLNISVKNAAADLGGVLILADALLANDSDSEVPLSTSSVTPASARRRAPAGICPSRMRRHLVTGIPASRSTASWLVNSVSNLVVTLRPWNSPAAGGAFWLVVAIAWVGLARWTVTLR